ncbi:MAG: cell division protein ZapA [Ruminococcaceae bacterium]|nr:cell division protein ZapA [Oscillospiraceae bacterium]
MKQKYTLSIADVELNVTVDEAPETVEYIVGVIDRKMREILLKSKYCPKTQAALLCALDLCADKVKAKEEIDALRDEIASLEDQLKKEDEKNRRAESLTVALEREKARLEIENLKLRAAIEEAQKTGSVPTAKVSEITADESAKEEEPVKAEPEQKEAPKKNPNKSRVGSMFDLLTFSDI